MITVIKPGLLTTVQDGGRWNYQGHGVPVAGVMDRYAYGIANMLVGNHCDAAVLEMTMLGGAFQFAASTWVAVCGANMQGILNGNSINNWQAFLVPAGGELTFDYAIDGCRAYLAVRGGIDVPVVMGSRSTYTRANIGGFMGRALKVGDAIPVGDQECLPAATRVLPARFMPNYGNNEVHLRVLLGPQDDLFTDEGISTFLSSAYTISSEADRMGYRLEGAKIQHTGKADIVSDALCQGAIQVPGHGMPIVMMADRATTGGYTKIGTVIGPDLTKMAQAKPGDTVRFMQCSDTEAVAALRAEQETYANLIELFKSPIVETKSCTDKGRRFKISVNGQSYDIQIEER